ncbi:MAG: DUF116 domain-containing protein [Promethearchaeota archaeon]
MSEDSKGKPSKNTMLMSFLRKLSQQKQAQAITISLEKLASRFGVDETEVLALFNQIKNEAYRDIFLSIPYSERIILFPQCLRHPDCEAKSDKWGYTCAECGRCGIARVKKLAGELGYSKYFIIRGGSIIEEIFEKYRPKAVVGIACNKEIFLGNLVCEKYGVITQSVCLTREGCYNTDADFNQVEKCVRAIDSSFLQKLTEKKEESSQI